MVVSCIFFSVGQWASCKMRKIAGYACDGNAGNVFPAAAGVANPTCITCVRDARAVIHAEIAK